MKRNGQYKRVTSDQRLEEVKLALEIADIIDELNMLARLFETQEDVLIAAANQLDTCEHPGLLNVGKWIRSAADSTVNNHLLQVNRMKSDIGRIRQELMDLLDLQQKEENLYEAQHSNQQNFLALKQAFSTQDQADETRVQSQILFIFTAVTIVFLPLSFFTSYFGMNVQEQTGSNGNLPIKHVWVVMGTSSGTIITALLGIAAIWYYLENNKTREKRKHEWIKLDEEGRIPPGLLDDFMIKKKPSHGLNVV
jgi:Mg2+ and Co2+ transporter CorA